MVYDLKKKSFETPDEEGKSEVVTDASNGGCELALSGSGKDTQHGLGEKCCLFLSLIFENLSLSQNPFLLFSHFLPEMSLFCSRVLNYYN